MKSFRRLSCFPGSKSNHNSAAHRNSFIHRPEGTQSKSCCGFDCKTIVWLHCIERRTIIAAIIYCCHLTLLLLLQCCCCCCWYFIWFCAPWTRPVSEQSGRIWRMPPCAVCWIHFFVSCRRIRFRPRRAIWSEWFCPCHGPSTTLSWNACFCGGVFLFCW